MPTKVKTIQIDNNVLFFQCEECEGYYLDTRVDINGTFFCCITWNDRDKFIKDFGEFMAKYRI